MARVHLPEDPTQECRSWWSRVGRLWNLTEAEFSPRWFDQERQFLQKGLMQPVGPWSVPMWVGWYKKQACLLSHHVISSYHTHLPGCDDTDGIIQKRWSTWAYRSLGFSFQNCELNKYFFIKYPHWHCVITIKHGLMCTLNSLTIPTALSHLAMVLTLIFLLLPFSCTDFC